MALTASDVPLTLEQLRAGTSATNIPTLLMVVYQVTGDHRWLEPPFRPTRSSGLSDHDTGGLAPEIQSEIRAAGVAAFQHLQAGRPPAIVAPSPDQMIEMLTACVGEEVDESYGAMFAEEFRRRIGIPDAEAERQGTAPPTGFRVLVIGAGVSGIIAAHRLQQLGVDFVVVDEQSGPGGSWRSNTYPGSGVDTPSHLYSFSFAPNDWSKHFELRDELEEYFTHTYQMLGAERRTRFGWKVTSARFDAGSGQWSVAMCRPDGSTQSEVFDAVISAVGILNRPKMPAIAGLDQFRGPSFHSSTWPADLDIRGKRVAVIGSKASAMQIVPAVVDDVAALTVLQRTPPWVAPFEKFQVAINPDVRRVLRAFPLYRAWYWLKLYWQFGDKVLDSLRKDPDWKYPDRSVNARNDRHRELFTDYIRTELGDRIDLFDKVLPTYPPYGKRILLDNGWYRALCQPLVELVDEAVVGVTPHGVLTSSGQSYSADVLVWATGFEASRFVSSLDIIGRNGVSLREAWDDDDARAYLGVTVPGFPNLFLLGGPNSFPGSGSFMYFMEVQMRYIARLMGHMFDAGVQTAEVRTDVFEEYNELVERTSLTTVWTHPGTTTFFRNERGRLVFVSPFRNVEYWSRAERSDLFDFDLRPAVDGPQGSAKASVS
jgi:4-hydroxyacetophenone monooxygenase